MPTTIEVVTQRIVVNPPSGKLQILGWGPAGPVGPTGPPGSGTNVAWPIVAPATSAGNITFTPNEIQNDIRGLKSPDSASWIRFWGQQPGNNVSWYLKANSGPAVGGLNGSGFLDADEIWLRDSPGPSAHARFNKTRIDMYRPLYGSALTLQWADPGNPPLVILASSHATSERAAIALGDWWWGQDLGQGGTHDFFLYSTVYGTQLTFDAANPSNATFAGDIKSGVNRYIQLRGSNNYLYWSDYGGGLYMNESIWLRSSKNFYCAAGDIRSASKFSFTNGGWVFTQENDTDTGLYYYGDNDFAVYVNNGNVGIRFTGGGIYPYGAIQSPTVNGPLYHNAGEWIRKRGSEGIYWESYGGGLQMLDSNTITVYNAKNMKTASGMWITSKWAGTLYYDQPFFNDAGASMAGHGWHPGGVAGCLRMPQNDPRYIFNNQDSGGYYNCIAGAWTTGCSETIKQDIVPLTNVFPMMPELPVATMVRALRPVWWRTKEELTMTEIPFAPEDWNPDDSWRPEPDTWSIHVCRNEGIGNCGHTPDDPCHWRVNWLRGQLGFVVEEVEKVLPNLVELDKDMKPQTIDLGSLIGLAYAMLQELDTRLTLLEERKMVA